MDGRGIPRDGNFGLNASASGFIVKNLCSDTFRRNQR
jgi:hypothetical protein